MELINIIVTGNTGSGKTTFVGAVSEITPITLAKTFPVGDPRRDLEFGRVTVEDDTYLYLVSTPLDERYHHLWDRAANKLAGFILIVDAEQKHDDEIRAVVREFESIETVPFIIIANRLANDSAEISKFRKSLKAGDDCQIIAGNVNNKKEVEDILKHLFAESSKLAGRKSA